MPLDPSQEWTLWRGSRGLWGSVLVVTLALVAFALAVTTLVLVTRLLAGHQQRRHVSPG
jgi:hypothetical protein